MVMGYADGCDLKGFCGLDSVCLHVNFQVPSLFCFLRSVEVRFVVRCDLQKMRARSVGCLPPWIAMSRRTGTLSRSVSQCCVGLCGLAGNQHVWDMVCSFCSGDSIFLLSSMDSPLRGPTRCSPAFVFLGGLNSEHQLVPWNAPENFLSDRSTISWADPRWYMAERVANELEHLIVSPSFCQYVSSVSSRAPSPVCGMLCQFVPCGGIHSMVESCRDAREFPVVFPFDRHDQERKRRPQDCDV